MLADRGVFAGRLSVAFQPVCQVIQLGQERLHTVVTAGGHPFKHQGGNRYHPAAIFFANQVRFGHSDIFKKNLVKLGIAVHLDERSNGNAGAVHINQQIADAVMLGRVRVGADQEKTPVRVLRPACPDFLTVHHKMIAVFHRARLEGGQVRTRARLGIALTPQLFGRQDCGQEALLLLLRPPVHQRGSQHGDSAHIDPAGHLGARQFFVENRLFTDRGPPSAVFLRPPQANPASGVQGFMPVLAPLPAFIHAEVIVFSRP